MFVAPHKVLAQAQEYLQDQLIERSQLLASQDRRQVKERLFGDTSESSSSSSSSSLSAAATPFNYPEYFLQHFHWQTDGYLSRKSAELYDYQVEALFAGTTDAMRRVLAAAPLLSYLRQR